VLADDAVRGSESFVKYLDHVLPYLHSKWELDPRTGDDKEKSKKPSLYESAVQQVIAYFKAVATSLVPLVHDAARGLMHMAPAVKVLGDVAAPGGEAAGSAAGVLSAPDAAPDVGAAPAAAVVVEVAALADAASGMVTGSVLGEETSDEARPLGTAVMAAKLARDRFSEWQERLRDRIDKEKMCE